MSACFFGGQRLPRQLLQLIDIRNFIYRLIFGCILLQILQCNSVTGSNGFEMVPERLAQGAETAGQTAAVYDHDKSNRRALLGAGLVVGARNIVLYRLVDQTFVRRHLQEGILNVTFPDPRRQPADLEIAPQQFPRVS